MSDLLNLAKELTSLSGDEIKILQQETEQQKAEDCILESAFMINGNRFIVGSSCNYGITTYSCDENWKPIKYACKGASLVGFNSYTDFHKHIRKMHGEENMVLERSSKLDN